ncbi:adhesion G-protein coupled receptor G2-like [Antedon mediterranea]|uniref:adhesion G-protein coupled receptor G2-like n=1 Tax=Antedon mediterranea TaxID=105859 RepID=UPI003AF4CC92
MNVTEENVEQVTGVLKEITDNSTALQPADIIEVSSGLEGIVGLNSTNENVTKAVINTIDNVLEAVENTEDLPVETIASLLASLEHQIATASRDGQNLTERTDNFALETKSINTKSLKSDVVLVVNDAETTTCLDKGCVKESDRSIRLPKKILQNESQTNLSFIVYFNDVLFPSKMVKETKTSTSDVILAATIYNTLPPHTMMSETMVELVFDIPEGLTAGNSTCVFWNETISEWSDFGCKKMIEETNKNHITCECSHLTSFSVLMLPTKIGTKKSKKALDAISTIGCWLSICCFTITIITLLSSKKLRNRLPQKIMINLCVALLCLDLVFVLGIDNHQTGNTSCIAMAALLHYFLLVSISWTLLEAISMYFLIIKIFNAPGSKFWWTAASLAWGTPLILVVALSVSFTDFYTSKDHCYIDASMTNFFIIFVIAPIAVIIGCNFIIFVMVIRKLFFHVPISGKIATKSRNTKRKRTANAISISLLLGLTWMFGFLQFEYLGLGLKGIEIVFVFLFVLLNSFQGVAVFILFCALQTECRHVWRSWFTVVTRCISNIPPQRDHGSITVSGSRTGTDTAAVNDISLTAIPSTSKSVI